MSGRIPLFSTRVGLHIRPRTTIAVRLCYIAAGSASLLATIAVVFVLSLPMPDEIRPTYAQMDAATFTATAANSLQLTWTAPGDDGTNGQAASYVIRYSTGTLSEGAWGAATTVMQSLVPQTAGSAESLLVTGLAPKTTYTFGLKTVDDAGLVSPLSNLATATTACTESWSCTSWSTCSDVGTQTRICTDLSDCGTTAQRPSLSRTCTVAASCVESWRCGGWSRCSPDGTQMRTCTDRASCGTTGRQPVLERDCTPADTNTNQPANTNVAPPVNSVPDVFRTASVVVAARAGEGPYVRVFTKQGRLLSQFSAYHPDYRGGVNLAVGDLGNDGIDEIIVGPGADAPPLVKVFSREGRQLSEFFAYQAAFRGGVQVAIGNVDGQGAREIVTMPASGGGPYVRIFGWRRDQYVPTILGFNAYPAGIRGQWSLAVGDVDGNRRDDIITVPGETTGGPHVRVFEYRQPVIVPSALGFFAYPSAFRGGVTLATGVVDGGRRVSIVTAPASLGGPHIKVFTRNSRGSILARDAGFFAFHDQFRGGVSVGVGDFTYDNRSEIVTAVRSGDRALVRIWSIDGRRIVSSFQAFPDATLSGVNVAVGVFSPPVP